MGQRYIIGDCHLDHKGISKFRKRKNGLTGMPYTSEEQHELMYEALAQVKRDHLFLMGDIAFSKEALARIKALPCRDKILLVGNHCREFGIKMEDLVEAYDKVYSLRSYKGFWLSHAPIHPQELRGKLNIHGHLHYHHILTEAAMLDSRYINVSAEYTGYKPILFEHVISAQYYEECQEKFDEYVKLGYADNTCIIN